MNLAPMIHVIYLSKNETNEKNLINKKRFNDIKKMADIPPLTYTILIKKKKIYKKLEKINK